MQYIIPVAIAQLRIRIFFVRVTWMPSVFGLVDGADMERWLATTLLHWAKERCIF